MSDLKQQENIIDDLVDNVEDEEIEFIEYDIDEDAQMYLDKAFASLKALEEHPFFPSEFDRDVLQRFISSMQLWQKVCSEIVMV